MKQRLLAVLLMVIGCCSSNIVGQTIMKVYLKDGTMKPFLVSDIKSLSYTLDGSTINQVTMTDTVVGVSSLTATAELSLDLVSYVGLEDNTSYEFGFCCSSTPKPTINDTKASTLEYGSDRKYTVTFNYLACNWKYYVRPYVEISGVVYYGAEFSLTTKPGTIKASDITMVDLGLSVKWADRNLGAATPADTGYYYCWCETSPKQNYFRENYKDYISYGVYKKYKYGNRSVYVGDSIRLQPEDDAATVNLGSGYRLPTVAQIKELLARCTFAEETMSGMPGYRVTGPSGNSIFFPLAGKQGGSDWWNPSYTYVYGYGKSGVYMASDTNYYDWVYFLEFNKKSENDVEPRLRTSERHYGYSVRAVCD